MIAQADQDEADKSKTEWHSRRANSEDESGESKAE
jgi:hypothetical protein